MTKDELCDLCKTATGPLSDSHPGISCLVVTAHLKMVAEMNQKAAHPYRDVQARPPERLSFDVPHETLREFLAWYAKEKLSLDIRDYKEVQVSWSRKGDGTTDALIVSLYGK